MVGVITLPIPLSREGALVACLCGWRGAPQVAADRVLLWCPRCQPDLLGNELFDRLGSRNITAERVRRLPKTGRNAPCPCGSGRKAKVCGCGVWVA